MKEDKPYILHMLDSIGRIMNWCEGLNRESFEKNELVRDATLRRIEVIGEAAKHLSAKFKEQHKDVPWKKIAGMRDKLIHYYMGVDYGVVWEVVKEHLPTLKKALLQQDGQPKTKGK